MRVSVLAASLVGLSLLLVAWKVLGLGYRLVETTAQSGRYEVEVTLHGVGQGETAAVFFNRPSSLETGFSQERFSASGLERIDAANDTRADALPVRFASPLVARHDLVAATWHFVFSTDLANALPPPPAARDTLPSRSLPAAAPELVSLARDLTAGTQSLESSVRALYEFVRDETLTDGSAGGDEVREALRRRRATPLGRVRLLASLARASGVPARVVYALERDEQMERALRVVCDVYFDGAWHTLDPVRGRFASPQEDLLIVSRGDRADALAESEGLSATYLSASVVRETANARTFRTQSQGDHLFDRLSFHRLPIRLQLAMRVLLLVPLGALIVSVFRNIVGAPTFGTFTPILIALAVRETHPLWGLLILALVVGAALGGRLVLARFRLLVVPRLSILLTFVIFLVGVLSVLATEWGLEGALGAALLPMVVLTMMIERVGLALEEEGTRTALKTTLGTFLVAAVGYGVLRPGELERTLFTFPELNLIVVALLLLVGRYTGFRLTELVRFRALAHAAGDNADDRRAA